MEIIPVILCGGSGTRLWPLSRAEHPKQFLRLTDEYSLLQKTALRALNISKSAPAQIVTVTLATQAELVRDHLTRLHPDAASHIIGETESKNTAAAIALAATYITENFSPDAVMWVLASDSHIGAEETLHDALATALEVARQDKIALLGVTPTRPETGYGYIRKGPETIITGAHTVGHFVEKPSFDLARHYLQTGDYLWNSGMFAFKASTILEEYRRHAPHILNNLKNYAAMENIPFDKAILEKSSRINVVPCNPQWSDIGSWQSLWEILARDAQGNNLRGDVVLHDSTNCLIRSAGKKIACAGLDHAVIIETPDTIFIADKRNPDAIKLLVQSLQQAEISPPVKETGT